MCVLWVSRSQKQKPKHIIPPVGDVPSCHRKFSNYSHVLQSSCNVELHPLLQVPSSDCTTFNWRDSELPKQGCETVEHVPGQSRTTLPHVPSGCSTKPFNLASQHPSHESPAISAPPSKSQPRLQVARLRAIPCSSGQFFSPCLCNHMSRLRFVD